ncbi:MAG TPA: Rrf2 family transcriptional regulator [Bacteroidales bacterium]|nr:Rrf2 family transcriptional regulator [Bacteroidales bacterium]
MLSSSCKYGIRAVTYIASKSKKNEKVGIKQISEDLNLPTPFLAKILQLLAKQKILSSSKGPHGGFSLLRDPRDISLLDIVTTIDGNDFFENCIIHNTTCSCVGDEKLVCPIHDEYSKIRANLMKLFTKKTIYSLVKSASKTEVAI